MKKHIEYFNLDEKIAALKLLIKLIAADGEVTRNDKKALEKYISVAGLKLSQTFFNKALDENLTKIINEFESRENLVKLEKLCIEFAKMIQIDPDTQGELLKDIYNAIAKKRDKLKTNFGTKLKNFFREFGYLWGQEVISPKNKLALALIFTILACLLGSFWTYRKFFGIGPKATDFVLPQFSAVISGLLIYSALAIRKYLPPPSNFRNILFFVFNVYLLSLVAMYILGRGNIEKTITIIVFFGLITLLWLGMKELLGFFFIGVFALFVYKVIAIDIHMDWRAFPFVILAFMGISFQSNNFFNDFLTLTNSFRKTPEIDKKIVKSSIEAVPKKLKRGMVTGISVTPSIEIPQKFRKYK